MTAQEFDPQRWNHWLVIVTFVVLSSWIIWKVYLDS